MSARVFSRLLAAARNARISYGGRNLVGLMGYRYDDGNMEEWLSRRALGTTPVPSAPGFLREPENFWPMLAGRYLCDIPFGPRPAGGCTVVALLKFDRSDLPRKIQTQFERFCELAGGHLPDCILQNRKDWPNKMVDRWLTFLWDCGVLDQSQEDTLFLTFDAFDASARAIERCRLNTDLPTFSPQPSNRANSIERMPPAAKKEPSEANGGKPDKPLNRPSDKAFQAWQIREFLNISNQEEIATKMTEQGFPATQGQVSKWLAAVEEWRTAGGLMPKVGTLNSEPQPVDPNILDMGARQDGLTPRQRPRRDSGADE